MTVPSDAVGKNPPSSSVTSSLVAGFIAHYIADAGVLVRVQQHRHAVPVHVQANAGMKTHRGGATGRQWTHEQMSSELWDVGATNL